ncbi:MAG: hypothetical protein ACREHC_07010 [Candidatus Levyibacteriota bacterium]
MQGNVQESRYMRALKKVWPFINRVLNSTVYFILSLIKTFFKDTLRMIQGK